MKKGYRLESEYVRNPEETGPQSKLRITLDVPELPSPAAGRGMDCTDYGAIGKAFGEVFKLMEDEGAIHRAISIDATTFTGENDVEFDRFVIERGLY